jgi:phosphoribosylanthranilate isomerase
VTHVKICGLKRLDDALVAAEAGAHMLGFVFAPSRRRIEPDAAADIITQLRKRLDVLTVGVFVNAPPNEMSSIADRCDLDYLQLSGSGDAASLAELSRPIINAIHVDPNTTVEVLLTRALQAAGEVIMLDTGGTGAYGGSGSTFDWRVIPSLDRPILLAGGLHSGNVGDAIGAVKPWGVDVSSGVETRGEKDQAKIRSFVRAVHGVPANLAWNGASRESEDST